MLLFAKIQDFFTDIVTVVDDGASVNHGDRIARRGVFECFERDAAFENRNEKRRLSFADAFNNMEIFRCFDVDLQVVGGVFGIGSGEGTQAEIFHFLASQSLRAMRRKKQPGGASAESDALTLSPLVWFRRFFYGVRRPADKDFLRFTRSIVVC